MVIFKKHFSVINAWRQRLGAVLSAIKPCLIFWMYKALRWVLHWEQRSLSGREDKDHLRTTSLLAKNKSKNALQCGQVLYRRLKIIKAQTHLSFANPASVIPFIIVCGVNKMNRVLSICPSSSQMFRRCKKPSLLIPLALALTWWPDRAALPGFCFISDPESREWLGIPITTLLIKIKSMPCQPESIPTLAKWCKTDYSVLTGTCCRRRI